MALPDDVFARIWSDPFLPAEFTTLCNCGGRRAGTASEAAALAWLAQAGAAAAGQPCRAHPTPYAGWRATEAGLALIQDGGRVDLPALPLLRSAATAGLEAEVLPLGRGTPDIFAEAGARLRGRIALVRHEPMFVAGHVHRRVKYAAALAAGAVGFLIEGPLPGSPVAGSAGRGAEPGIPAFGISPETAAHLAPSRTLARAHMRLATEETVAETQTLLFDCPGATDEWVVLSAHLDGHDPAESAIDNATGVAVALAVARALAPHAGRFRRGLRLALFSAEEWALTGSRVWLQGLDPAERARMVVNVNLDSVAGAAGLTALCSGFPGLADWARSVTAEAGAPVGTHVPLMANSDHANFAAHGIPALRLVAGFDDPASNMRHVLTAADTRDKVREPELRLAAHTAAALAWAALTATPEAIGGFIRR